MQMIPIHNAMTIVPGHSLSKRRSARKEKTAPRAKLMSQDEFEALLSSHLKDYIEGEFEDILEEENRSGKNQGYFQTLFPNFLLKSHYINYYI